MASRENNWRWYIYIYNTYKWDNNTTGDMSDVFGISSEFRDPTCCCGDGV
jgi:hypothetical protein